MACALRLLFIFAFAYSCPAARVAKRRSQAADGEDAAATCSGNGSWKSVIDWTCVCDAGWTGSRCSEPAAPPQEVGAECYSPGGSNGVATCEWYPTCLTTRFPGCKDHALEYAESYGQQYCQKFTDNSGEFSPAGQKWIDAVKLCLQEELVKDVVRLEVEVADCEELRRVAFDSHPKCYLAPDPNDTSIGICKLAFSTPGDLVKLLETTWDALFSRESVQQMLDVAAGCVTRGFLASVIKPALEKDGYDAAAQLIAN